MTAAPKSEPVPVVMTLRQWIEQAPFTLSLSSGFFGFFAHAGLISVLEREGLRPERITGCSAGALTGSLWAAGMPVRDIIDMFRSVDKKDFWDPGLGLGILKGEKFRRILEDHSPILRLEECPLPVAVSTLEMARWRTRVFETGSLPDIVYASCAIPPLFQPIRIEGRWYWDGAFCDRPALAGVPDNARVLYHHLESRSDRKNRKNPTAAHQDRLDLIQFLVAGLPAVHPDRLDLGPEAVQAVEEAFLRKLNEEI